MPVRLGRWIIPRNLDGVKLHARHKNSLLLAVLGLGGGPQQSAKVVVVNLLVVGHHKGAPPLLARLALHLVLVDGLGGVELGEVPLEVLEDVVVHLGQAQLGAGHLFENGPVRRHLLNGLDGELLLNLGGC